MCYGVRSVRINNAVKDIPARAVVKCYELISVEFHDEIEIVEGYAFACCHSLRGCIKLLGVKIVKEVASTTDPPYRCRRW